MTTTSYPAIVGAAIRSRRARQDVSLEAMAKHVGMTRSGWSRVESGSTTITATHLRRVACRLGCEPGNLVQDADAMATRLLAAGVVVLDSNNQAEGEVAVGNALLAIAGFLRSGSAP